MKRVALCVGVNQYDDKAFNSLTYSVPDAVSLKDEFKRQKFEAYPLTNPQNQQLITEVERRAKGLEPGDVFVFFFAGHGYTGPGDQHLLLCRDDRLSLLRRNRAGVPVDLLEEITNEGGYNRVFLLDACRTDIFSEKSERGGTRDLALVTLPDATKYPGTCCVVRSCNRFCPALEYEELGHGVFTQAVLALLQDPGGRALRMGSEFCDGLRKRMVSLLHPGDEQNPDLAINGDSFCLFEEGLWVPNTATATLPVSSAANIVPAPPAPAEVFLSRQEVGESLRKIERDEQPPEEEELLAKAKRCFNAGNDAFDREQYPPAVDLFNQAKEFLKTRIATIEARRKAEKEAREKTVRKAAEAARRREEEEARRRAEEEAWERAEEKRKTHEEAARKAADAAVRRQEDERMGARVSESQGSQTVEWDVRLAAIGPQKIEVIKEIRAFTGLGLKEAMSLVESTPVNVKENVSRSEAERLKRQLERVGARVELTVGGEGKPANRADSEGGAILPDGWEDSLAELTEVGAEERASRTRPEGGSFQGSQTDKGNVQPVATPGMHRRVTRYIYEPDGSRVWKQISSDESRQNNHSDASSVSDAKASRQPSVPQVGRNDPCPCGSGKKYKKCCGQEGGGRGATSGQTGRRAGETKTIVLPGGVEMEFVWCPRGTFERWRSSVTLTHGFWIAKTPVTQAQWKSVMGNNPSHFKGEDCPVETVSWNDARDFCEKTGLALPTEAQWEYAWRAGGEGKLDDKLDAQAWYSDNSGGQTRPVGRKNPNAWGLCDMLGNVAEWCQDWFGDIPQHDLTDPTGGAAGATRVVRGGDWSMYPWVLRECPRDGKKPGSRTSHVGFRPVCLAEEFRSSGASIQGRKNLPRREGTSAGDDVENVQSGTSGGMASWPVHPDVREMIERLRKLHPHNRQAGEVKSIMLPGGANMEMVWCPPGSFLMGSPDDEKEREGDETQHRVTLTQGFWIGKYPVTQRQWKSVMGTNPSASKGDNLPVTSVSWKDCMEYCRKAGNGLQLPTEAQWEYACRAGNTGAYAGSGRLDDMGWYENNSGNRLHPVGQKQPNAWGLYDMHGNVSEWCSDWYGAYPIAAVTTDPKGGGASSQRVRRGGGWNYYARGCRAAYRCNSDPSTCAGHVGFRLCCLEGG